MSSRVYYHSTSSSCTSLTVGVFQSSAGVTASLAVIVAYKLFPSLSPPAPEFRRTATPTYSQRRSRRSSVDTVATETSDISIDSVSTLVEPEIKRKHRLSSGKSVSSYPFIAQNPDPYQLSSANLSLNSQRRLRRRYSPWRAEALLPSRPFHYVNRIILLTCIGRHFYVC
ncbi:hypothetical protein CPB85DRAFT_155201 [Mucidula mucida]|nr:hypothetical protein CPB85DRAFT_155201 [Mucidula mucida]